MYLPMSDLLWESRMPLPWCVTWLRLDKLQMMQLFFVDSFRSRAAVMPDGMSHALDSTLSAIVE